MCKGRELFERPKYILSNNYLFKTIRLTGTAYILFLSRRIVRFSLFRQFDYFLLLHLRAHTNNIVYRFITLFALLFLPTFIPKYETDVPLVCILALQESLFSLPICYITNNPLFLVYNTYKLLRSVLHLNDGFIQIDASDP